MLRRAMALAGDTEVLLLASRLSPDYVTHVVNTALLSKREPLRAVVQSPAADANALVELAGRLDGVSGELYALALARTSLSPVTDDVFLARPNVFSFHRRIQPGTADQVVVSRSLDIVANDVEVRAEAGSNAFAVRIAQGVVDTAAEALTLGGGCGGCTPVANVSELQVQAERLGAPWVPIRQLDDPAWREVTLSADARRRAEADVRAGYVVLVPPRTVPGAGTIGWWRVDPKSGTTLGIMESGHGQGIVEFLTATYVVFLAISFFATVGCLGTFNYSSASPTKQKACLICGLAAGLVLTAALVLALTTLGGGVVAAGPAAALKLSGAVTGGFCNIAAFGVK
jgi:hypothetical protein